MTTSEEFYRECTARAFDTWLRFRIREFDALTREQQAELLVEFATPQQANPYGDAGTDT